MPLPIEEKMRTEWNERARLDAYYYVATARHNQTKGEFLSTAAPVLAMLGSTFSRIRTGVAPGARRALEIGCGPGRLILPIREFFGEVHGIDVSDEMIAQAREHLQALAGVHLHHGSGSDLGPLPSEYFDFVYSFAVFQHIPSSSIVTGYLEEANRVLKPGGVLCCQLNGVSPTASNVAGQSDTWAGCVYPATEMLALSRRLDLHLLQITGIDTPFMWVVARKPLDGAPRILSFADAVVKAITPTENPYGLISPRGPGAAFHCWLEGFPEFTSLGDIEVTVDGTPAIACYISDHLGRGGFQLNVLVPAGTPCGDRMIRFFWNGQPVKGEHLVRICDYPELTPAIASVTDGVDLLKKYSTANGSLKVLLTGIAEPGKVSFAIGPTPVSTMSPVLYDQYVLGYEFSLILPDRLPAGLQLLTVTTPQWSETVEIRNDAAGI